MKAVGTVRKIDDLGRVVIPMNLRKQLGIDIRDVLEFYVDDESIVLKKYQPGCHMCGSMDEVAEVKGQKFCKECAREIAKAVL